MTKVCTQCQVEKSLGDYYPVPNSSRLKAECKVCSMARMSKYARDNRDRLRQQSRERNARKYGITWEIYQEILELQGGGCAACGEIPSGDRILGIDHDHSCCPEKNTSCGKCVRGLLCSGCNGALGLVQDSEKKLVGLIDYLSNRPNWGFMA